LHNKSNVKSDFQEAKTRYSKLIRDEDVQHWEENGYVMIERFLSPEELADVQKSMYKHMPTWEEYKERNMIFSKWAGDSGRIEGGNTAAAMRYDFPYAEDSMNELAIHPFLFAFAERLAGTDQLRLSNGHLIGKYAGKDYDQALHSDYSNNDLVVPTKNRKFIDIPIIIYLTDVTMDLGPTKIVSQKYTEHRNLIEDGFRAHHRADYPELYEKEVSATVPAGSVVIYSMRTFHRGSSMLAKEGHRIVQFSGFHTTNAPWLAPIDHSNKKGSSNMNKFLLHADPRQREVVGFPGVGHEYWEDADALEGTAMRYPTMDMRPYGGGPPKANQ
jgi:ectoine hydroxylase-related dioxygenase (phytanoyl-CoA dioxygenase family)